MTRIAAWLITLAAITVLFAIQVTAAPAQVQCGSRDRMLAMLAMRYLEAPKAIGTVSAKRLMEIYVSTGGSWTILVTSADGNSCIVASGRDWEDVPFEPGARS